VSEHVSALSFIASFHGHRVCY